MNYSNDQIFLIVLALCFLTLILIIFLNTQRELANQQKQRLYQDFKFKYKHPISAKRFAIENQVSLAEAKQFLDDKIKEFGGIVLDKNSDTEYSFDIANDDNSF